MALFWANAVALATARAPQRGGGDMGFFDKLKGELVDIIEWLDDSNGSTLVWRFPRYQNEIKNGAMLVVRPGQAAVFVDQGRVADVFTEGTHELSTANVPVLSTLRGWKHGFNSPFKAEVYFVSTKVVPGLKWGTPQPLMLRDPDFGVIRLGAFGTYSLRCTDPKQLLKELVGTDGVYETEELSQLMRGLLQQAVADAIGAHKIPTLDLLGNYGRLADEIKAKVATQIDDEYGLALVGVQIVNLNVPEAVQKAIDQRSAMGALGSQTLGAAPNMAAYQQYQMGQGFANPGGGAGAGMNLGMGVAMASQMMNQMNQQGGAPPGMAPPPLNQGIAFHVSMNGQNVGPLTMDVVRQFISAGSIKGDSLVWTQGMASWTAAAQVPSLQGLFMSAGGPPPMPGAGPPPMPK
jgi:membrane protease subunit (stomatin/prohibitin family)